MFPSSCCISFLMNVYNLKNKNQHLLLTMLHTLTNPVERKTSEVNTQVRKKWGKGLRFIFKGISLIFTLQPHHISHCCCLPLSFCLVFRLVFFKYILLYIILFVAKFYSFFYSSFYMGLVPTSKCPLISLAVRMYIGF